MREIIHLFALLITVPLLGLMLVSRLDGRAGHLTDLAMAILAASGLWHAMALRRLQSSRARVAIKSQDR